MTSRFVRAVLALALAGNVSDLLAQAPVLVKDVFPGSLGKVYEPQAPSAIGTAGGLAYFARGTSRHTGGGLWVSNGSGPLRLVTGDLSVPRLGTELNGAFFFGASDSGRGGLWKTDGTPAGTTLVKRLGGGNPSVAAMAHALTTIQGRIYFAVDDGVHGDELWTSDGTEAGTAIVADATPGSGGSLDSSSEIRGVGAGIFFTGCPGQACRLWKSDGSAGGTLPLAYVYASSLAAIGTTLYFIGNGQELWKSDGTPGGTVKVADTPGAAELTAVGGTLFFRACDPSNGCELWKSDGTALGTGIVKDLTPGNAGDVSSLAALGGVLLFVSSPDATTVGLYRSDGTDAGTIPLASMAGPVLSHAAGGAAFLLLTGTQLWASDGTGGGTHLVVGVPPQPTGGAGPIPDFRMSVLGNVFLFGLKDAVGGSGITRSDGTAAGTVPLGPLVDAWNGSTPLALTDANGTLFFVAEDGVHGNELWTSGGTPETTHLVKDVNPGPDGSTQLRLVPAGGAVFFMAFTPAEGFELWRSDGTAAGTLLVKDIAPGAASSQPDLLGSRGDVVFFNAFTDPALSSSLWRSDGTDAGTFSLGGVHLWSNVADWRGAAWFVGSFQGVYALWKTDGTPLGTSAVAVIPGDSWNSVSVVRDTLVFSACDATHGCEPWISDGTPAGTGLLLDVNPGAPSGIGGAGFLPVGDLAMFWADDGVHGREPWVTDGSAKGTRLLADIFPGFSTSAGVGSAAFGALRLFVANDGFHGHELWKTDGTPEGTSLVMDINPGAASAFGVSCFAGGFRDVFFLASDGQSGEEMWRSDGTAKGTFRVADLAAGPASSSPSNIFRSFERCRRSGARIYFVADDGTTGNELWSVPLATSMNVLAPCRLLDTRSGAGAPLADGDVRRFSAAGACGIPPGAGQVVVNVTLVDPTADGSVEVGPGSPTWTGLAAVNAPKGRTRANNAILALATDGSASAKVTAPGGAAHLVVDVTGYFQ